jgi:DNA-binding NarL/FixJ family response regulator
MVALGPRLTNETSETIALLEPPMHGNGMPEFIVETNPSRIIACFNGHSRPDVMLLDFSFPGFSGVDGIRSAIDLIGDCPLGVLVPSVKHDIAALSAAAGARAVLPVDLSPRALHAAVVLLKEGMTFAIVNREHVIERLRDMSTLSDREIQVLSGICKGLQNKEIAHAFDIQEVTVKMHVRAIIRKLGARNRTHAAMLALDVGLV